jgi:transcriptional regulator with XRE-family HTH domain
VSLLSSKVNPGHERGAVNEKPNEKLRALRRAKGWTQGEIADAVMEAVHAATGQIPDGIDEAWVGRLERGRLKWPNAQYRAALRAVYAVSTDADLGLSGARTRTVVQVSQSPDLGHLEQLRRALDDTFNEGAMTLSTLDEWEASVVRYGAVSRDQPAGLLISDLSSDLAELQHLMSKPRPVSSARRLTRVTAQMCGLLCLALIKLDHRREFRGWARIARVTATEAGDPETLSWVLAQEAYGYYYSNDLAEALAAAQAAQECAGASPRVGAVLAAALEARILGALARPNDCRQALGRAETILSNLPSDYVNDSAFGYDEGQFRFHEGNAYTHLRDTAAAWTSQQRALELCAPNDFMDRTFTRLDRSICLVDDGDISGAIEYALETMTALDDRQRQGIITLRGRELLHNIPARERLALPAADELRDRLLTTDTNEAH